MGETILNAMARTEKPRKLRGSGFIPGVLYGDNLSQSASVKFEEGALRRVLNDHGANAKVWVTYDNGKKFGVIREVQRQPITGNLLHIDIQMIGQGQDIRLQLPITFKGKENLEPKHLLLHVNKSEVEVTGKAELMPDAIVIDVSAKNVGDNITSDDFQLTDLTVLDKPGEVYGIITAIRTAEVDNEPEVE